MIKGQKDQGSRSQWGRSKRRSSSKNSLLISLSMRRYHHRENWVSVLWALPQACKHPGPRIWGSPGRPTVDTASCPPLRKLQAELQLIDYFMNSETTVMSQVPRNLFHHSKHNPTKTQILRMGEEKWWFSRRGFVKEYAFYYKKKKKSALWREDGLGMGGGQLTGIQYWPLKFCPSPCWLHVRRTPLFSPDSLLEWGFKTWFWEVPGGEWAFRKWRKSSSSIA